MLTLLAAALMQPAAAAPSAAPELRCMAAYLFALGQMPDDANVAVEDKAAVTTIMMYFFGKVRAHAPTGDVFGPIAQLVDVPGYVETRHRPELERCGKEFEARVAELATAAGE